MNFAIVDAVPGDAPALTGIALRAKAVWGYPPHWLEVWRPQLTIAPAFVARHSVRVATTPAAFVGFAAVVQDGDDAQLEHLWIEPAWIGWGVGRALFEDAVRVAGSLGATRLTIEADPNAEGFYLRMGSTRVGDRVTEIDGRERRLPVLRYDLSPGACHSPN